MGINATICEAVVDDMYDYGCLPEEVRAFTAKSPHRRDRAIEMIGSIMTLHGKAELLGSVSELARVEEGIRGLQPWIRDHVVHALLSFILGMFINERFLRPQGRAVDKFQWKLAGLLHDVGYPAEVATGILGPFADQINSTKRDLRISRPDLSFSIVPRGLDELGNDGNSLDLIQGFLDRWGLHLSARDEYDRMLVSGKPCHGIISSLSVLYVIDMLYEKHNFRRERRDIHEPYAVNWNQLYFEDSVVPACAAMFVHNLPARCFVDARIDPARAPLAFLLKLSDSLQDWERPSADNLEGIPDDAYSIEMRGEQLIFTVHRDDRRSKIMREVSDSLGECRVAIR